MQRESAAPTVSNAPQRRHLSFKAGLAQVLGVNVNDIVLVQDQGPMFYGPPRLPHHPPPTTAAPEQTVIFGSFQAALRQPDGSWRVVAPQRQLIAPWQRRKHDRTHGRLRRGDAAGLVVRPCAGLPSIAAFARAAERLGRDPDAPPLTLRGSTEIRSAVAAFNLMQEQR